MADRRDRHRAPARGPSGLAIASLALAMLLVLITVLATQLRHSSLAALRLGSRRPHIVVVRHVYETVIQERIIPAAGASGAGGTTVSSSGTSFSSSAPLAAAPTTRTS